MRLLIGCFAGIFPFCIWLEGLSKTVIPKRAWLFGRGYPGVAKLKL